MTALAGWRYVADEGHCLARLERAADGWLAHYVGVLTGDERVASWATVELDEGWLTRSATVRCLSETGDHEVRLERDRDGAWTRDGRPAPELAGCTDVDIAWSPLTNTFPIRRHAELVIDDTATLAVAWIDLPSLDVTRVDQTYRRRAERTWEYRDPTYGPYRIEVDAAGLVVDYEDLATRV